MSVFGRARPGKLEAARALVQPVSFWQETLLKYDEHPECTAEFRHMLLLSQTTLVRPRLDKRRLQRALDKVFLRHDSLRIQFERIKGKWRAVISPPGPVEILEVDASGLDQIAFDAAIVAAANTPMPLIGGPLAEVVLVKGGEHGDAVIARVHHAISDGFGMVVLFEDLFKYILGLPVLEAAVSHADYLLKFQSPAPDRVAEIEAFWAEQHRDFPPTPMFGRLAKGRPNPTPIVGERVRRCLTFTLPKSGQDKVKALSLKLNVPVPTLIFATHYQALCECFDIDRVAFMSHITRSDPGLATFMGDHTLDAIMIYTRVARADFEKAVVDLSVTYMNVMAHLPSGAARMGTEYWDRLAEQGAFPSQFSAYQPRAVAREEKSIFKQVFRSPVGTEFNLGPYKLSTIDAGRSTRVSFDMQVKVDPVDLGTIILRYDALSLDEPEVKNLADVMCDLLGVEHGKATFS